MREPGKGADSGGWAEDRERRGMGYGECISAHTMIRTTKNSGHDVHSKCMRNQTAVCLSHACMWESRFVDVICVAWYVYSTMYNEQSRTRARGLYVDSLK